MNAVVFGVDMKKGWEGSAEQELDQIVGFLRSVPGFVRGTWTTDGSRGLSFILFESEEAARGVAENVSMPPDAGVTLRSAGAHEVVREA